MPVVSQLELPGSPVEISSQAPQTALYWNASAELLSGETLSAPVARVLQYDPTYPNDTVDVTSTVVTAGSPSIIASGVYAGDVQVLIAAKVLVATYEYRIELAATGSSGTNPWRFLRVRCLL